MGCSQKEKSLLQQIRSFDDAMGLIQIKTDSIYNSNQSISLLVMPKKLLQTYQIEFGYSQKDLKKTSTFAKNKNAFAAINGGFFNMDNGGSATYFESNDSVINYSRDPKLKWGIKTNIVNGAIVINKEAEILIQAAHTQPFYESSKEETAVLITGPLLLIDSQKMKLPNLKFSNKRHPRTCLCMNKNDIIFITIDGRQKEAQGMNLVEVQQFLQSIGCTDAINLDGGGSTTMWMKNKGIINHPSDKAGERPVANVLLIVPNEK